MALMREMGRITREGCAASEGEPLALPEGMLQHTLVYPDGTWK